MWFLEPEAGGRPEICLPGAGSVREPAVAVWPLAVRLLKKYIAPYSDQVPYHLSPLSSKFLIIQVPHRPNHVPFLSTTLDFSIPFLSPGWKILSLMISTFMIFRLSSPSPSLVGRFFINWSLIRFSSSVFHWVRRFFLSNITLWDSSASP